jgi:site-specific recombinase XerD
LKFLGSQSLDGRIPEFGIIEVDRFLEQYRSTRKITTIRAIVGVLRSFVKFLYQRHILKSDLSDLIESPRNYKLQTVVPVLKWTDVQQVLHAINTHTKHGIRSYALLMLMVTYGLRVGEVARLKLTDIDWRKEIIHINSGKSKYSLELPLTADVGKAILQYLKYVRPRSDHQEVFLLNQAPWNPISSSDASFIASQCMRRAGLQLPRYGAHLLRHSFATHLLQRGASLKEIGDMLGHQHPDSTYTYTKSAVEHLREVALEVPR